MPEYLAPGVYVEEIPSGNKPIAAASTSTAAVVGLTERGPINTPTLCTSLGSYNRQFGGNLNPLVFMNHRDALPYAAEGFFNNGGSRLYVTRIIGDDASESELQMVARDTSRDQAPVIVAQAMTGDESLLLSSAADLGDGDTLSIADGATSEMVAIDTDTPPAPRVAVDAGLSQTYIAAASSIAAQTLGTQTTLAAVAGSGTVELSVVDVCGIAVDDILALADPAVDGAIPELVTVTAVDATANTLTLAGTLQSDYPLGAELSALSDGAVTPSLAADAAASGARVVLELASTTGLVVGTVLRLNNGSDDEFVVITGLPAVVTLEAAITANHAPGVALLPALGVVTVHARYPGAWGDALRATAYPAAQVETTTVGVTAADSNQVRVTSAFGLFAGSVLVFAAGAVTAEVEAVDTATGLVTLTDRLIA